MQDAYNDFLDSDMGSTHTRDVHFPRVCVAQFNQTVKQFRPFLVRFHEKRSETIVDYTDNGMVVSTMIDR